MTFHYSYSLKNFFIIPFFIFVVFGASAADGVITNGDGNILKRSPEESCHTCHKTNANTPSVIAGAANPDWANAIKMHSSEILGSCSNTLYQTMSECIDPAKGNGVWTPGKWSASGGWGVGTCNPPQYTTRAACTSAGGTWSNGQYGVFLCTTCHTVHETTNIYLMRESITAPTGNFPGGANSPVKFRKKNGVPGEPLANGNMGDDTRTILTSSTNVCEVCHSKNKYHNYDATNPNQTDWGHNNAIDCSGCHSHKNSFKGSCKSCHGVPPGQKHATHFGTGTASYGSTTTQSTATAYSFNCGTCHNGAHVNSNPPNPRTVEVIFAGTATQDGATGAAYTPSVNSVDSPSGSSYTFNYSDGTCRNIYCHGNYPGSGKNASPTFVSGTAPCGSCHEATNTTVPASASHSKHALSTDYDFSCTVCHYGIVGGTGPASYTIADKTKHVSGNIDWQFDPTDNRILLSSTPTYSIPSGTVKPSDGTRVNDNGYTGYGTCNNLYCHSNANPLSNADSTKNVANAYKTPTWGGAAQTCYSCHKGRTSNSNLSVQQTEDNTQANCTSAGGYWDIYCVTTQNLCCTGGSGAWNSTNNTCTGSSLTWGTDQLCRGNSLTQSTCETALSGRWVTVCVNSQTDPTPLMTMNSNAHHRLVNPRWIRKYPCVYCHSATVDVYGNIASKTKHVDGTKDIQILTAAAAPVASQQLGKDWSIPGKPAPSFDKDQNSQTYLSCKNIYCHSDGRENINYTVVTPAPWNGPSMQCNSCHGHPMGSCATNGCHDGTTTQTNGLVLPTLCSGISQSDCEANSGTWSGMFCQGLTGGVSDPKGSALCSKLGGKVDWPAGKEWMAAAPMFPNAGPGSGSENSHPRHIQNNFACTTCHYNTAGNGVCSNCHTGVISGSMAETAHVNPVYHVNKMPDITFQDTVNYQFYNGRANPNQNPNKGPKSCMNPCHVSPITGPMNPSWGGSLSDSYAFCKGCHGTNGPSVDYYGVFTYDSNQKPLINLTQWTSTGHGRPATNGDVYANPYSVSQNPAANFESAPNPCWYCHDNTVLHTDSTNPFRLKKHEQFRSRFEKECVYCHMQGLDSECLSCHNVSKTCSNSPSTLCSKDADCGTGNTCAVVSLAPQLIDIGPNQKYCQTTWADGSAATFPCVDHTGYTNGATSCTSSSCHYMTPTYQPDSNTPYTDYRRHNTGSGLWTQTQQSDVRNQYVWMGVCLKCHDEDSEGQCTSCHQAPASNPTMYALGYDGGMGQQYFITALKAKASSFHFGYKHYNYFENTPVSGNAKGWDLGVCSNTNYISQSQCVNNGGTWTKTSDGSGNPSGTTKGGKFCWDCHNPHGRSNIYMINGSPTHTPVNGGGVATSTDGIFGKPITTADVTFTTKTYNPKSPWGYYAVGTPDPATGTYDGICNVCHQTLYDSSNKLLVEAKHWTNTSGDGHNNGKVCTSCHNHKFTDSHSSGLECDTCHKNKPVPRHTGFSLPRDCTKCHIGIGKRIDIMGQMQGNSHHVQGITVTNRICYICHWEATNLGIIDPNYHLGYNFKNHSSTPGSVSDLVIWGAGARPTTYANGGSCSGSGVNCSSYTNQPACTAVTNCQWNPPSATTLANGGFCSGSGGCSGNVTQATCLSPCTWTQLTAATFNALFVGSDPTTAPSTNGYVCSDGNTSHNTQALCTGSQSCSNSLYTTPADCSAYGYGWVAGVWGTERDEVEKTTPHCLGCHSDQNKDTKAFSYCSIPINPQTGSSYLTQYDSCSIAGNNDSTSCQNAGGQWLTGCLNSANPYYCSKPGYHTQTSCQNAGYCNKAGYSDQTSCQNAGGQWSIGYCSIAGYIDKTHCQNVGGQWLQAVWSQPTWISDCKTPKQYAWDRTSVASRYLQTGTTTWGKYTSVSNASPRNFTKAYSAHGNAKSNQGGWDNTGGTGLDGSLAGKNMRAATRNVQCFDCHSSHGSKLVGNTSSYTTTYGPQKCNSVVDKFKTCNSSTECSAGVTCTNVGQWGGNLKETVANRGGYVMDYTASYNPNTTGVNPYAAGAGQCFDCHESQQTVRPSCSGSGTCSTHNNQTDCQTDVNNCIWSTKGVPWGYSETFGAAYPIMGYWDSSRFGSGSSAANSRYTYKKSTKAGGHLHASSGLTTNSNGAATPINGLCTPCHDPHGVSPTLGSNQAYGVPLLKGTWLTSLYKEDVAATGSGRSLTIVTPNSSQTKCGSGSWFTFGNPNPSYNIDQNTFDNWNWSSKTKISETTDKFAGLCLGCHPQSNLHPNTSGSWKSVGRIHNTVNGWGGQGADANNAIHAYPCAKCHTPHVSDLPRLMVSNCLNDNHKGRVASGGYGRRNHYAAAGSYGSGRGGGTFPSGGAGGGGGGAGATQCSYSYSFGFGGGYNSYTSSYCHDATNNSYFPSNQQWNTKTPW